MDVSVALDRELASELWRPLGKSLPKVTSFDEVIELMTIGVTGLSYRAKEGCREARGCTRAEFFFSVPEHTYQLFFNSAVGYRAQFYSDHRLGSVQNQRLLSRLAPVLLSTAIAKPDANWSQEHVIASLFAQSAKIWINEDASTLDQKSVDVDSLIAITIPHWVASARQVTTALKSGMSPRPTAKEKALLGIQAPEGTEVKVLGAWLNDITGREYVVPSKRNRAREIRVYGFA